MSLKKRERTLPQEVQQEFQQEVKQGFEQDLKQEVQQEVQQEIKNDGQSIVESDDTGNIACLDKPSKENKRNNKRKKRRKSTSKSPFKKNWIETCGKLKEPPNPNLTIIVTRVELEDSLQKQNLSDRNYECAAKVENFECSEVSSNFSQSSRCIENEVTTTDALIRTDNDKFSFPDDYEPLIHVVKNIPSFKFKVGKKYESTNFNLPNGDCGDGIVNPFPNDVQDKYWAQRRRLFSRFDEGIKLNNDGWYSVTPEAIANHIANRMIQIEKQNILREEENRHEIVVLDAFCGCGGNTIAFAKKSEISLVIAVDMHREKLQLAAHNASIYQIPPNKVILIHADSFSVMNCYRNGKLHISESSNTTPDTVSEETTYKGYKIGSLNLLPSHIDAVFLSPPWGGPSYGNLKAFDFNTDLLLVSYNGKEETPVNGQKLIRIASSAVRNRFVVIFLPRNLDGDTLGRASFFAGYGGLSIEMEQNILNGKLKTITAYLH